MPEDEEEAEESAGGEDTGGGAGEDEVAQAGANGLASGAIRRPLELKRKAAASPSPRKPTARSYTPRGGGESAGGGGRAGSRSEAPGSTPGSAQDEVTLKRRMLRAKLAEAESPLAPPTRIIP